MAPDRRKRPLAVRLLLVAVTTLVALFVLYGVGVNVLLSTSLFQRLVNAQPSDTVDIQRAWSIVPQHVHAEKVSVRGRDSSIEWMLRIDDVDFHISLLELVKQQFSASHIRARGISFRLRQRLDAEPTSPEQVAYLPPIEGLPGYAVRPPRKPDLTDANYNLWTVHLETLLAEDVREVWVDNIRFEGDTRVEGRFYFKPLRAVEVGPVRLDVARGELSMAQNRPAEGVNGRVDATVTRFDPRATGAEALRAVSLATDVHLTIPDIASLPLPIPPDTTIHGAIDVRRVVLHVTSGKLEKDTHLALAMPSAVATVGKARVAGALALDADVNEPEQLTFHASMTDVEASREGGVQPVTFLRAPKVTADGGSSALDLAHARASLHFVVDAPATIPDVAELPLPLPAGTTIHGALELRRALLRVASGRLERDSHIALAIPNAVAIAGKDRVCAALTLDADVNEPERFTFRASVTDLEASREAGAHRVALLRAPKITADGGSSAVDIAHALAELHFVVDAPATIPDVAALPLPLGAGTTIHGALEVRHAVLRVASGKLEKDSHIALAMPRAVVITPAHRVTGALMLAADVGEANRLAFHASMSHIEASHLGVVLIRAPEVTAVGDSRALDLTHALADLHFVIDVPEGSVPDASALSRYIPRRTPVEVVGGEGKAQVHFEAWLADRRATGRAMLRAESLDFRLAQMRVRGLASVQAQFGSYHFDTERLEDARMTIDVPTGVLASNAAPDTPLVRVSGTRLTASAPSVDLGDPLRALSVSISLPSGDVVTRGLLREYLPKGSEMQIASSHSRFSLNCDVAIVDHLARGTLDIDSRDMTFHYRDLRLGAQLRALARVHEWHWETGHLALDDANVEVENVTLSKGDAAPAMSIARIGVGAKSQHFDFGNPLGEVNLSASFVDARIHDFSAANAFLPSGATYRFEGKDADFVAGVEVAVQDHAASGGIWARALNTGITKGSVHLRGDVDVFAAFADWKGDKMRLLDSRVQLSRVAGSFAAVGPPQLSGEQLLLSTSSPHFDLAHPTLRGAEFHLVVDHLDLPDLRVLAPLMPRTGVVGIESGSAHVNADIHVSHARRDATGGVDIHIANGGVRVRQMHLSGDFRFVAHLSGFGPEGVAFDVSGSRLEMRDVAVTNSSAATSGWRGDIVLRNASLSLSPHARFDGAVDIDARDVRPVLALAFGNDLSKFVVGVLDMPRLAASTRLIVGSHELAMFDLDARGGDVALRGSYALRENHRRGAFIAKKAFVSVGLRIDDQGSHPRFFGLNTWLRERTCGVKDLLEMAGAGCPVETSWTARASMTQKPAMH